MISMEIHITQGTEASGYLGEQGRIQDFGKGGSGSLLSTKMCHICAHAQDVFPSF